MFYILYWKEKPYLLTVVNHTLFSLLSEITACPTSKLGSPTPSNSKTTLKLMTILILFRVIRPTRTCTNFLKEMMTLWSEEAEKMD